MRDVVAEGGVELGGGPHEPEAVGAEDLDSVALGFVDEGAFQRPPRPAPFAETRRHDHGGLDPVQAAGPHEVGDRGGGRGDDGEVYPFFDGFEGGITGAVAESLVFGVDGVDGTGEVAFQKVAVDAGADGFGAVGGTEDGDGGWGEEVG